MEWTNGGKYRHILEDSDIETQEKAFLTNISNTMITQHKQGMKLESLGQKNWQIHNHNV